MGKVQCASARAPAGCHDQQLTSSPVIQIKGPRAWVHPGSPFHFVHFWWDHLCHAHSFQFLALLLLAGSLNHIPGVVSSALRGPLGELSQLGPRAERSVRAATRWARLISEHRTIHVACESLGHTGSDGSSERRTTPWKWSSLSVFVFGWEVEDGVLEVGGCHR